MKKCTRCGKKLALGSFYKNASKSGGYARECKQCSVRTYGYKCYRCKRTFYIKHRNTQWRRGPQCPECRFRQVIGKHAYTKGSGRIVTRRGYVCIRSEHTRNGYVLEHRDVVSRLVGRELRKDEQIHHIDGNRENNAPANLWLTDAVGHSASHRSLEDVAMQAVRAGIIAFSKASGKYHIVRKGKKGI